MESRGWMESIVILASCKHHFIRVHENLVQHPSNNISIIISLSQSLTLTAFISCIEASYALTTNCVLVSYNN